MKEDKIKFTEDEKEYLREGQGCLIWSIICLVIVIVSLSTAAVLYFGK